MVSLSSFLLNSNGSIRDALDTINNNGCGICFVVKDSVLIGIATDGDVRRALLNNVSIDASIELAMNKSFKSLPVNSDPKTIRDEISHKIRYLPLCDGEGRLVDVADIRRSHTIPVLEPKLEKTEFEYVHDCLETGWISSQGRYVKDFEQIFSEMHSGMTALAVSNGTTALHLALMALGISDDDEVIVPNITFAATINAVLYCNATPVICEVSYADWCIDVNELEKLITPKTKAVIPVHLYGVPCEMDKLVSLCKAKSIHIIEDCAESLGSKFDGTVVGTFGDAATFSFFGNKTISTGEGLWFYLKIKI